MSSPTSAEVLAAVEACEPATVMDVLRHIDAPWPQRTTVRNRLWALVAAGELIADEERPVRFALNHLLACGYCGQAHPGGELPARPWYCTASCAWRAAADTPAG